MSPPLLPLGLDILVKRDPRKKMTSAGLVNPNAAEEMTGTITAMGHAARETPEVKVGDRVFLRSFGGTPFDNGDDEYIILRVEDLLGRVP